MRLFQVLFGLLLASSLLRAIVIVSPLEPGENLGFGGEVSAASSKVTGNSDVNQYNVGGKLSYGWEERATFVNASYTYGEAGGVKNTDNTYAHLRYLHRWDRITVLESYVQIEKNEFVSLKFRGLAGGGVRWKIKNGGVNRWYLGAGAFYSQETIEDPDEGEYVEHPSRGNVYLSYKGILRENVEGTMTLYYQPLLEDGADHHVYLDGEVGVVVIENVQVKFILQVREDSRPPEGREVRDTSTVIALGYKF